MDTTLLEARAPFRRSIEIRLIEPTLAVAELEDDYHHFRVTVTSDGGRVASAAGQAIRFPWSMCPLAAGELTQLVGATLTSDPAGILHHADIRQQCTHMFDLAGLAVAALGRGGPSYRRYDMQVLEVNGNLWDAQLLRNDGFELHWSARLGELAWPSDVAGRSLKAPFLSWAREHFPGDAFEAALALRRTIFVGKFRHRHDLDQRETAAEGANMGGCFVLQPQRASKARRNKGATVSFPQSGPGPLPVSGSPSS
jgi:hypothetical protein